MIKKMIAADWLAMKSYHNWSWFIVPHMIGFSFLSPHIAFIFNALVFFYFSTTPFFLEEKDDLNYLYLTLPIKRSEIVSCRYAFSLVMYICGMLIISVFVPFAQKYSLFSYFIANESLKIGFNEYFILISASYLMYAFFNLSSFPCLFKLGYAKGKMWGYYLPAVMFMLLFTIALVAAIIDNGVMLMKIITFTSENPLLTSIAMFGLATIILAVSYLISLKAYSKRDF